MAQQQVDISAMSLEQLNTYKGQFENEIKQLHARHSGLKQAEGRFRQSKDALAAISKDDEGRRMLVPLTQSLYGPGNSATRTSCSSSSARATTSRRARPARPNY